MCRRFSDSPGLPIQPPDSIIAMGGAASRSAVQPTPTRPTAPGALTTGRSFKSVAKMVQATERMKTSTGIKLSTEAYIEGALQDAAPIPGSATAARPEPFGAAKGTFGTYKFNGATARPFLEAQGLSADVLDSPDWTERHAPAVARAVSAWAAGLGALHVCHWTQPFRSATGTWRSTAPTRMVHASGSHSAHALATALVHSSHCLPYTVWCRCTPSSTPMARACQCLS